MRALWSFVAMVTLAAILLWLSFETDLVQLRVSEPMVY